MDVKALKNNIFNCLKTTEGLINACKKLLWLYGLGKAGNFKSRIVFKYPDPIGKLNLCVRDNKGSDAFIFSEVFDNQCYQIPRSREVCHILDLGSNAGFTAVYYSKLFPNAQIACVEPMPGNVAVLKENLALNKVNATVFEVAATINDETITMDTGDKDYANKVQHIPFGKKMNNGTLKVEGLTIDTIINKLKWEKIDLIKIDIEGYEGILLANNNEWLGQTDTIIMEIHEGVTINFIKKITDRYGFIYVKHQKGNWILSKNVIF